MISQHYQESLGETRKSELEDKESVSPAVVPQLGDGVLLRAEHEGEFVVRLLLRAHREHLHLEETHFLPTFFPSEEFLRFSYSLYNSA